MLPNVLKPMLATPAEKPFDSREYLYEIKWDGYRCLAFLNGATRLQSRNLNDISHVFPDLGQLSRQTKLPDLLLDGEIIALRDGKPSFLELQKRAQLRNPEQIARMVAKIPVVYVVFDLLYLNGASLLELPLIKRRQLLEENLIPSDELVIAGQVPERGIAYFSATAELGLEGVIAKKADAPYSPGKRVKTWLKFKHKRNGLFIVCGFIENTTSRGELRSLILGAYHDDILRWCGMVGTGFTMRELALLHQELRQMTVESCPFTGIPLRKPGVSWVKPLIPCEIEYFEVTDDGSLRHPTFLGFRPDKQPSDCQLGNLQFSSEV